jgi:hypothetical protein
MVKKETEGRKGKVRLDGFREFALLACGDVGAQ